MKKIKKCVRISPPYEYGVILQVLVMYLKKTKAEICLKYEIKSSRPSIGGCSAVFREAEDEQYTQDWLDIFTFFIPYFHV